MVLLMLKKACSIQISNHTSILAARKQIIPTIIADVGVLVLQVL